MVLNKTGLIVEKEWFKTKEQRSEVDFDEYVIMPNHLHGIIIFDNQGNNRETSQKSSLGSIIGQFKSKCTKRVRESINKNFGWQKNYYDHIIRNQHDLDRIRKYINENPLKWGIDELNVT